MATAVEIALELFNPYPVGTSESNEIFNFVLDSSFFETIFSMTLLIKRELIDLFSTSITIPFPCEVSISTLIFFEIPSAAPLPVAIAFTIEIALWIVALATAIKLLQVTFFSSHHMVLPFYAKFQTNMQLDSTAFHNHKL